MKLHLKIIACLLTVLAYTADVEVALKGPAWMYDGVVYSIFPRDFSPAGDFKGVNAKLGDLKKLGVTILWFLPIHPIGEINRKGTLGSPYSVKDYYAVNPAYGTKEDFKNLVQKAHQMGFKVIKDSVINHTAWDAVLMKKKAFYKQNNLHQIVSPLPQWSDVAALDYSNPELRTYMINMLKYWLKEFDLDGFRFDAASFIPLDFWEKVRTELTQIKPDILLLGEEENPEALAKAFNLDYDWKLEEAVNNVVTNGLPAQTTLQIVMNEENATFPRGSYHLRFIDNHDKKRAIVRFGEKGSLAASLFIFTVNGVPLIYNGMEVGNTTESTDPALFEKLPIYWGSAEIRPEFLYFYQQVIQLRKNHPALRTGEMIWLKNSDEARILTYSKKTDQEEFLIVINMTNQPFNGVVEITAGNKYENLTSMLQLTPIQTTDVLPNLSLKAWEYRVYKKLATLSPQQ